MKNDLIAMDSFVFSLIRRASFIVMSIALIIIAATFMMTTAGILAIVDDVEQGNSMGFRSVC